jgi:hypothetical protein
VKGVVRFLFAFADEWRARGLGKKITRRLFPKMAARREEKRKARQGLPVEIEGGSMNEQIASVIRTIIKSAGGGLVGAGVVTNSEMEALAGAAAILLGLAWSWWVKRKTPSPAA